MGTALSPRAAVLLLLPMFLTACGCSFDRPRDGPAPSPPEVKVLTGLGPGRHSLQLQLPSEPEGLRLAISGWHQDACTSDVLP